MGISKLIEGLQDFLELSKKKQGEKYNKLLKIIDKLEKKNAGLQRQAMREHGAHKSSDHYHELTREMRVISELIKKAKQHDLSDQAVSGDSMRQGRRHLPITEFSRTMTQVPASLAELYPDQVNDLYLNNKSQIYR